MYSSEDLASFYFQYQTKALPHVKFLQSFCMKHKVPIIFFISGISNTSVIFLAAPRSRVFNPLKI